MPRPKPTDLGPSALLLLPGAEWSEERQAVTLPLSSVCAAASELRLEATGPSMASRIVCTASAGVAERLVAVEPDGAPTFVAVPAPLAPTMPPRFRQSGKFSLHGVEWVIYGHDSLRNTLSRAAATRGPSQEDIGGRAEWFSRRHPH